MGNFALKAIRKVAAISTGIAMLGATMTGALAADYQLGDYPTPFGADTVIVVGNSLDDTAAADIASGLPKLSASSGGTASSDEVTEDIPLNTGLGDAETGLDATIEDNDISTLLDTQISFRSADYDVREVFLLGTTNPKLVTSLTSGSAVEDDYKSDVYMETNNAARIRYYYAFDDAIFISNATSTNPLEIKFLGKTLKITSVASATQMTAYVGAEYFMDVGDSVTANGKTITLENVGSGGAVVVSVDGVLETIPSSSTETVNGIEITNDETFYEDNKEQRSASLVVGEDSQETIKNDDMYFGGDDSCTDNDWKDPDCWVWEIDTNYGDATATSTTLGDNADTAATGAVLGIHNDFIVNDYSDVPITVGECIDLPNNYLSVCFDSLTVADTDYMTLKLEKDSSVDFSKAGKNFGTSIPAIKISSSVDDTIYLKNDNMNVTNAGTGNFTTDKKVKTIYLAVNQSNASWVEIFYKDPNENNIMKYAGAETLNTTQMIFQVNYENTKDTNVEFDFGKASAPLLATDSYLNLTLDILGDNTNDLATGVDDITMEWKIATGNFSNLGSASSSEESREITWGATMLPLGNKDVDLRSVYGIVIKDPKSKGASDSVELLIPSDQVKGKVIVKGTSVTGSSVSEGTAITPVSPSGVDVTKQNTILVGGPCANSLTAQVMGGVTTWPDCATGFEDGKAVLELKKQTTGKYTLIAAGYSADDTRRAAVVLKEKAAGKDAGLAGSKQTVTGTGLTIDTISLT